MSAYMRGYFWHLDAVNLDVFLNDMLQIFFPVKGNHWHIILIQTQKTNITINHRLNFRCFSISNDSPKTRCFSHHCTGYKISFVSFIFFLRQHIYDLLNTLSARVATVMFYLHKYLF